MRAGNAQVPRMVRSSSRTQARGRSIWSGTSRILAGSCSAAGTALRGKPSCTRKIVNSSSDVLAAGEGVLRNAGRRLYRRGSSEASCSCLADRVLCVPTDDSSGPRRGHKSLSPRQLNFVDGYRPGPSAGQTYNIGKWRIRKTGILQIYQHIQIAS